MEFHFKVEDIISLYLEKRDKNSLTCERGYKETHPYYNDLQIIWFFIFYFNLLSIQSWIITDIKNKTSQETDPYPKPESHSVIIQNQRTTTVTNISRFIIPAATNQTSLTSVLFMF